MTTEREQRMVELWRSIDALDVSVSLKHALMDIGTEVYDAGREHGAAEERKACAHVADLLRCCCDRCNDVIVAAIRARGGKEDGP